VQVRFSSHPIGSAPRFGVRYRYAVDSIRENLWRCIRPDQKSSAAGSVRVTEQVRGSQKTVSILERSPVETYAVAWIENPCVGGSIPPQATSFAGRSSQKRATSFHRTVLLTQQHKIFGPCPHTVQQQKNSLVCLIDKWKINIDYAEEAAREVYDRA